MQPAKGKAEPHGRKAKVGAATTTNNNALDTTSLANARRHAQLANSYQQLLECVPSRLFLSASTRNG